MADDTAGSLYVSEEFSADEAALLSRHFTNLDKPVFALKNLPEVVKGALFARYSRSAKSLRRLFLDEFVDDLDVLGQSFAGPEVGAGRAEALFDRVFFDFGDDSVAQLGGVHLACEQASNMLTKVLEWGRLMAYLEQSTRYIAYDKRLGDRFRYYRSPEICASGIGSRYLADMDAMFEEYSALAEHMRGFFAGVLPRKPADSDAAYTRALNAKALDAVRGMLPAASLSNLGIYGTGQAYEALLLRMRAHPLPEARSYADMMLTELREVIPSFLRRVDLPDRGQAHSGYLEENHNSMLALAEHVFDHKADVSEAAEVELVDYDPDGETKTVAAMLYPYTCEPESAVLRRVEAMTHTERVEVIRVYCGQRNNRRHRPGRALERTSYRFDILSDYGAFRDLQRHRLLTIEWQPLSTRHGYLRPEAVDAAGASRAFDDTMSRSAELYEAMHEQMPHNAPYATSLAYRVRYNMQMNAREAMHVIELRTTPQGHPNYRRICQRMHQLIAEQAGHQAIAAAMSFADHTPDEGLGRLASEERTQKRVQAAA